MDEHEAAGIIFFGHDADRCVACMHSLSLLQMAPRHRLFGRKKRSKEAALTLKTGAPGGGGLKTPQKRPLLSPPNHEPLLPVLFSLSFARAVFDLAYHRAPHRAGPSTWSRPARCAPCHARAYPSVCQVGRPRHGWQAAGRARLRELSLQPPPGGGRLRPAPGPSHGRAPHPRLPQRRRGPGVRLADHLPGAVGGNHASH